ncbi:NRDE family protein [Allomuricauda sp. F6463D]|uniref:NRDE family protein n=1 Tax=Allomuricauda sp. F6463D TaxID=2926409 RepID=UPI001FF54998|nr:NRDE family protein [Muricauda sp. F6463D]MCK0160030.1 NRDE family protein [Muricauda sp. F6463D]
MCTVSYSNGPHGRIITSTRDENVSRAKAIPPKLYRHGQQTICYPKDPSKGGTWMAIRKDGWVAVLLNGALEPFKSEPHHIKSRGMIMLELMRHPNFLWLLKQTDFHNMAPFTLLLSSVDRLIEVRWNDQKATFGELDVNQSHIWSSATLYDKKTSQRKESIFREFLNLTNGSPLPRDIFRLHKGQFQRLGTDVLHKNGKNIISVSITQAQPDKKGFSLDYEPLAPTVCKKAESSIYS